MRADTAMMQPPVDYFAFHKAVLRFTGINLMPIQQPVWRKLYNVYAALLIFVTFVLYTVLEFGAVYQNRADIDVSTYILCYWVSHVMGCMKGALMLIDRDKICKYLVALEQGVFKPNVNRGGQKEIEIVKNAVWVARTQAYFFFLLSVIIVANTLTSVARSPTVERPVWNTYTNINTTTTNSTVLVRRLPWYVWLWFDTTSTPNYELVFAYQLWCIWTFALLVGAIDTMMAGLMVHVNAQFRMLRNAFESVVERVHNHSAGGQYKSSTNLHERLSECLDYHNQILDLSENMERQFNLLILAQFLVSTMLFCFQLFQLSYVPPGSPQFLSMGCYLLLMLFQLAIFCYNGNEITCQSELVGVAAYNCDWFHADDAFKRSLVLVMARAQRPVRLSAGKFAYLSLEMLMNIIRGSISYYMVLHQMNG